MNYKHIAASALIAFVVIAVVGRVSMLKTLAGFQANS